MPPAVNDIIRVIAKMSQGGGDIQNVYHYRIDAIPGTSSNANLLSDLTAHANTAYTEIADRMPDTVLFDTVSAYNLTQDEFVGEGSWTTLVDGDETTTLPPQNSALVLFSTDTLRSQGRKFLPPFSRGIAGDDGTIIDTVLADIAAYAADYIGTAVGSHFSGVFGNYNETLVRFAPWATAIVRDFFATQRRRYFGSGS